METSRVINRIFGEKKKDYELPVSLTDKVSQNDIPEYRKQADRIGTSVKEYLALERIYLSIPDNRKCFDEFYWQRIETRGKTVVSLSLNDTRLDNLEPLGELSEIEILNLGNTYVNDVFPLCKMKKLKKLDLHNTPVEDISPIGLIYTLESLNLNSTHVKSVSVLRDLPRLKEVHLKYTTVSDISELEGINGLTVHW